MFDMKSKHTNQNISKTASRMMMLVLSALLIAQVAKLINTTISSQKNLAEQNRKTQHAVKQSGAIRGLFGASHHVENQNSVKINGAISISGKSNNSAAILTIDNKPPQIFRIGQELAPKLKLIEVAAGFIVVENDGIQEKIKFPDRKQSKNPKTEPLTSKSGE